MNNTIFKGIQILRLISSSNVPLTITEIAQTTNIPKTTVFNIVATFTQEGLLKINPTTKTYSLGIGSFELGVNYLNKLDLYSAALPYLEKLCHATNQTAYLAKKEENEIVYILKIEPESSIRTSIKIGTRIPLYSSSLGKSILSTYNESELKSYLNEITLNKFTPKTITDKDVFLEKILTDKKNGFSISDGELEENIFCVGVPIFDHTNTAIAAISFSTLSAHIDKNLLNKNIDTIKEIAASLSKDLGYVKFYNNY